MPKFFILFVLCLCSWSCQNRHVDYIQGFYYNEKSNYYLKKKDYEKSQTTLLQSKEKISDRYELDSNLGVVFDLLTKSGEAEKSFDEALKVIEQNYPEDSIEKKQALFLVYYNRGVYYQGLKKVDEALQNYQSALDIDPTSMEIKTNIELLIQKQQEDQKKQGQSQDQKPADPQNNGQSKDKPDDKNDDKENDKSGDNQENNKESKGKEFKPNQKYQPRPFKGEQLSEGDVKKILGELSQQDKKIRSQFNKKDKEEVGAGVDSKNEKDW